jgi:hypothetical protein
MAIDDGADLPSLEEIPSSEDPTKKGKGKETKRVRLLDHFCLSDFLKSIPYFCFCRP